MKLNNKIVFFFYLVFGLFSCNDSSFLDVDEAELFIIEEMKKFSIEHKANGYLLEMMTLPVDYLAVKEYNNSKYNSQQKYDSLRNSYGESFYFLLNIKPQEGMRQGDIMLHEVKDYDEYQEKFLQLSFELNEMLSFMSGDIELEPILFTTEHGYGLINSRSVLIAFSPNSKEEMEEIKLNNAFYISLDDRIFNSGITQFHFSVNEINNYPTVRVNDKNL